MKTLNKTLCLVLALVMVLGLFGVASAAGTEKFDDFTDKTDVQYEEAVSVLTGIGAINGMGDGTFAPKAYVTRAQGAKIVAYAILGEKIASQLTSTASSFTDVDANTMSWAGGCIEYLVKEGIINGRGDKTFDPNGQITGYEMAKMLLCTVGYGANAEYTGAQWQLNVAVDASKLKVFKDSNAADFAAGATREETALYIFNAITSIKQVKFNQSSKLYENDISALGNGTIQDEIYNAANKQQLTDATTTDDYGRPATQWKYGVDQHTIAFVVDTPVLSYTTSYVPAEAYKALKDKGVEFKSIPTWAATTDKVGGNGIANEFYVDADGYFAEIVTVNAFFAQATGYEEDKTSTVPDDRTVTFDTNTAVGVDLVAIPANDDNDGTKGFETAYAGVKSYIDAGKDVGLIVTPGVTVTGTGKYPAEVAIPTSKELTVSATSVKAGKLVNFTADGTTYEAQANSATALAGIITTGNKYTVYFDQYGYAVYAKVVEEAASVGVIVDGAAVAGTGTLATTNTAEIVKTDATKALMGTKTAGYDVEAMNKTNGTKLYNIVAYKNDTANAGLYTFAAGAKTNETGAYVENTEDTPATGSFGLVTGKTTLTYEEVTYNFDSKTIFIVETIKEGTSTYKTYTGIKNAPTIDVAVGASFYTEKASGDAYVDVVFVHDAHVKAVATDTIGFLAIDSTVKTMKNSKNETVAYYDAAYITGAAMTDIKQLKIAQTLAEGDLAASAALLSAYTEEDGIVTGVTAFKDDGKNVAGMGVGYEKGLTDNFTVTVNATDSDNPVLNDAHTIADDCVVWVIDPSKSAVTDKFSAKTYATLAKADKNDKLVWVAGKDSGTISALYVIKVADNAIATTITTNAADVHSITGATITLADATTTVAEVTARITKGAGETAAFAHADKSAITPTSTNLIAGDTLTITAADGSTTTTYTFAIKA